MAKRQIIAKSPKMQKLLADLPKIARSNASIFICGESGTGKEVIAHAIHYESPRIEAPFIKVNCPAIPDTLLESEFFGHEKGAFTGAVSKKMGRFERASEGSLLLDEISEIPLSLQAKLLRAVQEQEFERIGGVVSVKTNIRFISTSNRNMKQAIEQGLFRKDLYYRLNVIPIYLYPLRERKEDIVPLAQFFLKEKDRTKSLTKNAKEKLLNYSWPGNIRELSNAIERAVVMSSENMIDENEIFLESSKVSPISAENLPLKEVERLHILRVLSQNGHNRTKTAKDLGISIRTLRNKLNTYQSSLTAY